MKSFATLVMLTLVCLLVPVCLMAQTVPTIDAPNQTDAQAETHFLTFIGSFVPENPTSATAYYNGIDPGANKRRFTQWLVNAGFISQESDWQSTGQQMIVNQPGCSGTHTCTYGPNIVNADAHVIVLNAADLGFVRNQFIRCVPSCTAKSPMVYTYLENYPVFPFSKGGSNFGDPNPNHATAGTPTQAEATAAIQSAITRPAGVNPATGVAVDRIADVAFEWAPPETNPTSSSRFGQQYAFLFFRDCSGLTQAQCNAGGGTISETINWSPGAVANQNARLANQNPSQFPPLCSNARGSGACLINVNQPFAPELDSRGAKQMPGVCLTCHGGNPQKLTSTGAFPHGGNIGGFRFLPLDNGNLMFTTPENDPNSRTSQQSQIKTYNQAVLLTIPTYAETDDQGVKRVAHVREVIQGWYASFPGDNTMSASTQNESFVPVGWGGDPNTTLGKFYLGTVAPNCRTCHFNRELSLDFGTVGAFDQESDLLQLVLLVECNSNTPGYRVDPNLRPMPLAHLTFERLWQNVNNTQDFQNQSPSMTDQIAAHFGLGTVQGYCATNP